MREMTKNMVGEREGCKLHIGNLIFKYEKIVRAHTVIR